jgi:cell shape-determining protein MreC
MNYLQKSKKYPNRLKIIFIASLFVLFFGLAFLFPKATHSFFTTTAVPVWKVSGVVAAGFQNVAGFFSSKSSLVSQVSVLQNQIASLELKQADYDAVSKENQDLKNLFGQTTNPDGRVLARVLSKPPQSPYDTFVLSAGSGSGVAVGDKVYISDTVLIGEVADVTAKTSIVNLFSKSGITNTLTDERTGAGYSVSGEGGANMSIQAPKDADILWGDTFSYPTLATSVVGSVFYIDQSAQSSFKTVFIRVPGNVFQTEWVFVQK